MWTPELEEQFFAYVAEGLPIKLCCQAVGIGEETFYSRQRQFPEFSEAIKKHRARAANEALKSIKDNEAWQAKAWFLERLFPLEFGLPQVLEKTLKELGYVVPGTRTADDSGGKAPKKEPSPVG